VHLWLFMASFVVVPVVAHLVTFNAPSASAASALILGTASATVSLWSGHPLLGAAFLFFLATFLEFLLAYLVGLVVGAFGSSERTNYKEALRKSTAIEGSTFKKVGTQNKTRQLIGWSLVVALSVLELAAALGLPGMALVRSGIVPLTVQVAEFFPLVSEFASCAGVNETDVRTLLALNVVFLPLKFVCVLVALPPWTRISATHVSALAWKRFYAFMIGMVAVIPLVVWLAFKPTAYGLWSLNAKASALCQGGLAAFNVATLQSGFALLCLWVSASMFSAALSQGLKKDKG
jgi:hypothetical protein